MEFFFEDLKGREVTHAKSDISMALQAVVVPGRLPLTCCDSTHTCASRFQAGHQRGLKQFQGEGSLQKTHVAMWLNMFCIYFLI